MTTARGSCEQLRAQLGRGELSVAAEEHLLACDSCAAHSVGQLEESPGPARVQLEALLYELEARIARERGLIARLRSRSSWQRWAIVLSGCALLLTAATQIGSGLSGWVWPQRIMLGVCLTVLGVVLRELLSPTHRPERPRLQTALGVVALLVPAGVVALHPLLPDTSVPSRSGCLRTGLAVGFGLLALLRVLDRSAHRGRVSALLATAASGLLANLALVSYCPGTQPLHLLVSHAPIGLLIAALYLTRSARVA